MMRDQRWFWNVDNFKRETDRWNKYLLINCFFFFFIRSVRFFGITRFKPNFSDTNERDIAKNYWNDNIFREILILIFRGNNGTRNDFSKRNRMRNTKNARLTRGKTCSTGYLFSAPPPPVENIQLQPRELWPSARDALEKRVRRGTVLVCAKLKYGPEVKRLWWLWCACSLNGNKV